MLSLLLTWGLQSFVIAQIRTSKDGERIDVHFTSELNQQDLEQIKEDVKSYEITLVFNDLDFDRKGKLSGIDFSVNDRKGGSSGSAKTTWLTKDSTFGFLVDRTPGASVSFGTGDIGRIK